MSAVAVMCVHRRKPSGDPERARERKPLLMHDDFRIRMRSPVALPLWLPREGTEDRTGARGRAACGRVSLSIDFGDPGGGAGPPPIAWCFLEET